MTSNGGNLTGAGTGDSAIMARGNLAQCAIVVVLPKFLSTLGMHGKVSFYVGQKCVTFMYQSRVGRKLISVTLCQHFTQI